MVNSKWFQIVLAKEKPLRKKFECLHQVTHSFGKETQQQWNKDDKNSRHDSWDYSS